MVRMSIARLATRRVQETTPDFASVNGHTATSFTGTGEELRMVANVEPDDEPRGLIVGDKVQGLGISNMKRGASRLS
jgi:hypothetical protein